MGFIEKRGDKFRARYRDPVGHQRCETFLRKRDAERFLIYLAVDSGMRWSELIGLRRGRLDMQRGKVRVVEQLIRLETKEWVRKEPKTASSVRSITISPVTAELLKTHLERFSLSGPDGLVFPNAAGNPVASSSFWGNHFTPAQERAGVSCRFHDLRHTSVALAIAEGAHPKAIQTRMGHSSINVTLDRYGHLFPELDEAIAVRREVVGSTISRTLDCVLRCSRCIRSVNNMTNEQRWTIEFYADVNGRQPMRVWMKSLSPSDRAALTEAVNRVLQVHGINVCESEWGKQLGGGLFEFRIRHSAPEITRMFGQLGPVSEVRPKNPCCCGCSVTRMDDGSSYC